MKTRALITGITGQTGSYMADLLLEKDYEVYGLIRRTSQTSTWRINHCLDRIRLIPGDLTDQGSLARALKLSTPDEVYNFASQSHVGTSFEEPLHTGDVTGLGALRLLEAVHQVLPQTHFYQASSSEQFGNSLLQLKSEDTSFHPVSPYGCAKVFAHLCMQVYRKAYQQFIVCGIAFNHESPRRSEEFVTRKITKAVAEIKLGKRDILRLGNTLSLRDWTHAKDIVQGIWLAMQQKTPDDYVFASGMSHSVQEFLEAAFQVVALEWNQYVHIDPTLYRPTDIHDLCGNADKAFHLLGWKPRITFLELVKEMVTYDFEALSRCSSRSA